MRRFIVHVVHAQEHARKSNNHGARDTPFQRTRRTSSPPFHRGRLWHREWPQSRHCWLPIPFSSVPTSFGTHQSGAATLGPAVGKRVVWPRLRWSPCLVGKARDSVSSWWACRSHAGGTPLLVSSLEKSPVPCRFLAKKAFFQTLPLHLDIIFLL